SSTPAASTCAIATAMPTSSARWRPAGPPSAKSPRPSRPTTSRPGWPGPSSSRCSAVPDARLRPDVSAALETYYTRYYRDTLGIPGWRGLVDVRLDDEAYERQRLTALEKAMGGSIGGARLLNVGCGTGGFNALAEEAGAEVWGVDELADAVAIARARMRHGHPALRATAEAPP